LADKVDEGLRHHHVGLFGYSIEDQTSGNQRWKLSSSTFKAWRQSAMTVLACLHEIRTGCEHYSYMNEGLRGDFFTYGSHSFARTMRDFDQWIDHTNDALSASAM